MRSARQPDAMVTVLKAKTLEQGGRVDMSKAGQGPAACYSTIAFTVHGGECRVPGVCVWQVCTPLVQHHQRPQCVVLLGTAGPDARSRLRLTPFPNLP